MKNKSIVFKLTFWVSLILTAAVAITFLAVRLSCGAVLHGTIKSYVITTVEENAEKISIVSAPRDTAANVYLPLDEGYLEIDLDFMDVTNGVYTALYSAQGALLYGEDPLAALSPPELTATRIVEKKVNGVSYELFEMKIDTDAQQLWIRGAAPESESAQRLKQITGISLFMLPALIVLAVLSGVALIHNLLSPLSDVERAAGQISRGEDLGRRINSRRGDEIGRLSDSLDRMLDRLERSFETERRFTSDASHELRTPTSVILAQADYTLEKPRTDGEYREALEVIKKQGERMSALIDDMLSYTRLEQREKGENMQPLDLSSLCEEICSQCAIIGEKGITLECDVQPGVFVNGDRLMLSRLLTNLISNAYRYGKQDGHIRVRLEGRELSVADDGIGIAESELEKIFDRFYRSDSARSGGGAGLGLSIVKKIAELHGAEVSVKSAVGEGSIFTVKFPPL